MHGLQAMSCYCVWGRAQRKQLHEKIMLAHLGSLLHTCTIEAYSKLGLALFRGRCKNSVNEMEAWACIQGNTVLFFTWFIMYSPRVADILMIPTFYVLQEKDYLQQQCVKVSGY